MAKNPLRRRLGRYVDSSVNGKTYRAFVPPPLPPAPPLEFKALQKPLEEASTALGRLDGVSSFSSFHDLLLYYSVRKEAVLSSQIEGTQSSLSDLLRHESDGKPPVPLEDVGEVVRYVKALNYGLKRVHEDGFPLSLRLIREIHEILLSSGRGSAKQPGEFRTVQNWIGRGGEPSFVPPPPNRLMACLDNFEKYLHDKSNSYGPLIDASLIHVQFETIHPFLDGNGRVGRLLITFFLIMSGVLRGPSLYLSLFFKKHQRLYYEKLNAVRAQGDWEGWLRFFLTGVAETATQAVETSLDIEALFKRDAEKIYGLKRSGVSAIRLHEYLREKPFLTVKQVAKALKISAPSARAALNRLRALGIVSDRKGDKKEQLYVYTALLDRLEDSPRPA